MTAVEQIQPLVVDAAALGTRSTAIEVAAAELLNRVGDSPVQNATTAFVDTLTKTQTLQGFPLFQASQSFTNNQDIEVLVTEAKSTVDTIKKQLEDLRARTAALMTRMDAAYAEAMAGQASEQQTFTDAASTLNTISEFSQRAQSKRCRALSLRRGVLIRPSRSQ